MLEDGFAAMKIALTELADLLQGKILKGDADLTIEGFASLKQAQPGDLSFFYDARYRKQLASTRASALLVAPDFDPADCPEGTALIEVEEPSRSFQKVVESYSMQPRQFEAGIHPGAVIADDVDVDPTTMSIGAGAVIENGVALGKGVEIGAGCFVGRHVSLGEDTRLYPNVTIHDGCQLGARVVVHSGTVIGADGFGYEFDQGRHRKIRQAGIVQIDDDVEIGASTTIDRARFGRTWIGEGTKIDNQVQIGHNTVVGKHCILVANCGLSGSVVLGDYVVVAAGVGIADHVSIGSMATIGALSGVTKDIPAGRATYLGFPATEAMKERRRIGSVNRLPQLLARVKELESRLDSLEGPDA
jgi:UDP-3-O-[3-hydroxymyristoyl] glucosamine N-acyltransferase